VADLKVAVDGTRLGSGGGLAHLIGILDIEDPSIYGVREVHVWAHRKLLDAISDRPWIIKHQPKAAERSVIRQLLWQATTLSNEIKAAGCHILFSADASTLCRFAPMVTFNQNLLPFEDSIMPFYGVSKERLRLTVMATVQKSAFKFAEAVIFLTHYAQQQVQRHTGKLAHTTIIPHGVDETFKLSRNLAVWPFKRERAIRCLYVSPVFEYKHHVPVVRAIARLRTEGYNIELELVGGVGRSRAKAMLDLAIAECDPNRSFVKVNEFLPHQQIIARIAQADIFVFASGCETFGIALLEAMAVGVPIACSNQSSLPETLQDAGEYFDPSDEHSIASALDRLINDPERRQHISAQARQLAAVYSWPRCAGETWRFITDIYERYQSRAK
jgi:glycosyltransferase involved in cell wall biosynthesis